MFNRSQKLKHSALSLSTAAAVAAFSFALVACGDSGPSDAELNEAKQAGAAHAREQIRIKQIQHELRALRHGGGSGSAAPATTAGSGSSSSTAGASTCGGELSTNSVTTCPFAENVKATYFEEIGSGSGTVYVYSPVTGKSYTMYCTAGSPHECTGGNDAAVFFP